MATQKSRTPHAFLGSVRRPEVFDRRFAGPGSLPGLPVAEVDTQAVAEVVPIGSAEGSNWRQACQKILGLDGPKVHVLVDFDIQTSARGHREAGRHSLEIKSGSVRDKHSSPRDRRHDKRNVGNGKAFPKRSAAKQSLDIGHETRTALEGHPGS